MQRKGFTLIELLAVIVILAVIAFIATPIIVKLVGKSRQESLVDSAYGLEEAANLYYINNLGDDIEPVRFVIENGKQVGKLLEYKGHIEDGELILSEDGKIGLCISDGRYSAYKNQEDDKVISGVGKCAYNEETGNFEIVSKEEVVKCNYDVGHSFTYTYTGNSKEFKVPCSGNYLIELWGASGGGNYGGNGAYTSGNIALNKNMSFLIEIGGTGKIQTGGYNGGGSTGGTIVNLDSMESFGGGGATDIRLNKNALSRIMVASGGGGQSRNYGSNDSFGCYSGGAGGTLTGFDGCSIKGAKGDLSTGGKGASQLKGGDAGTGSSGTEATKGIFALGGKGGEVNSSYINKVNFVGSGGGGGYYGGGGGGRGGFGGVTGDGGHMGGAGGGGSSYISGYDGCYAVSASSTEDAVTHLENSIHYSGYQFINGIMIDGKSSMPTYDHLSTMEGNKGNGYAKITYLGSE